jgi:hypothetical protein
VVHVEGRRDGYDNANSFCSKFCERTEKIITLLLLEALQLQRSFGLLNEFFPCGSVPDTVLPVVYSRDFTSFFTSSSHLFWGLPSDLVDMGVHSSASSCTLPGFRTVMTFHVPI